MATLFDGIDAFVIEYGIGKVQLDIIRKHIVAKGGSIAANITPTTTHIFTKLDPVKCLAYLKWPAWQDKPQVYTLEWVTESIKRGKRVGETEFLLSLPRSPAGKSFQKHSTSGSTGYLGINKTASDPKSCINNRTTKNKTPNETANITTKTATPVNNKSANKTKQSGNTNSKQHKETSRNSKTPQHKHPQLNSATKFSPVKIPRRDSASGSEESGSSDFDNSEHLTMRGDDNCSRDTIYNKRQYDTLHDGEDSVSKRKCLSLADESSLDQSWLLYTSTDEEDTTNDSNTTTDLSASQEPLGMSTGAMIIPSTRHGINDWNDGNDGNDGNCTDDSAANIHQDTWKCNEDPLDHDDVIDHNCPSPPLSPIGPLKLTKGVFFVCQNSITSSANQNHNKGITDILQQLEDTAESTGDKWRAYAYRKAVTILKNLSYKVTSYDQIKHIKGIGNRIAEKIREIIETGKLRKAEIRDPMVDTLKLFSNVFGAGPETVKKWYAQGFRTLRDVAQATSLTHQQSVGIKYYHDFLQRIPREEVSRIESLVQQVALGLDPSVQLTTCGSYRRGKADCGDIDILLSQIRPTAGFLKQLVDQLQALGVITDHLTSSVSDKYMGVCRVDGNGVHRRIDLRLILLAEWPCALLYFTGSDHFNRSMRLWARKHGYSLNEHALVQRWGRLNRYEVKGEPLTVATEEDVFKILGLDYREPKDRDV